MSKKEKHPLLFRKVTVLTQTSDRRVMIYLCLCLLSDAVSFVCQTNAPRLSWQHLLDSRGGAGGNGGLSQQLTLTRCRVEAVCRVENIRYHEVRKVEQILLCFTVCCVVARGAIIRWKKNRIICPLLCLTLLIMIVQRVKQKYVPHCVKS